MTRDEIRQELERDFPGCEPQISQSRLSLWITVSFPTGSLTLSHKSPLMAYRMARAALREVSK